MDQKQIVEVIELATRLRGDAPVARWRIEEALQRIAAGKAKARLYPNGNPHPKDVHCLALGLF